jgi:hypothetical protein
MTDLEKPCTATLVLDYDSLTCYLSDGQPAPTKDAANTRRSSGSTR